MGQIGSLRKNYPQKTPALLELTCDSEKVLYLLKYKVCGEILFVAKEKTKFRYGFTNYKSENRAFGKFLRNYFTFTIVPMDIVAL